MTEGAAPPPHLRTLARFASLTGARAAPALPPGAGDPTDRFLALATGRGMFRAETNLRFVVSEAGHGTRFIHLGAGSGSARLEAGHIAADFAASHATPDAASVRTGLTDSGRVPFVEVRSPWCSPPASSVTPRVLAAYFDEGVLGDALDVARDLRRAGIACWFFHEVKNLAKHLRLADRFGAEWIVIVGGREWDMPGRMVALRRANTREEHTVPLHRVVPEVAALVPVERFGE